MTHNSNELARRLKVLAVGARLKIVKVLRGRALCVGAIAAHLDLTQGAVSQHLRVMRDAGLVIDEKHGYYVHYRLNERTLARWHKQIDSLLSPGPAASRPCSDQIRKNCGCKHSNGKRNHKP